MQVEDIGSRILESSNKTRRNQDRGRKVKGVLDWLTLKGVKDLQKFLGLENYYCWFIKNFVMIARPLYDMMKKDQKQEWTDRQEKAFQKLKEKFIKELVLAAPDLDRKIRVEVNILNYTIREILSMEYENGK